MRESKWICISFILLLSFSGCNKDDDGNPDKTGKLAIKFEHRYNGLPLLTDTLLYLNEAGNLMMFTEVQYFISDVTLHAVDGSTYLINAWKNIHYVDNDQPGTLSWDVYDNIPTGRYASVSFTFGIDEEKNQSFIFVNPPESLMFWPEYLGGGYHYLKLNGKWKNPQEQPIPFNFHLGIGQQYDNEGNITGFIQNYFRVTLPVSSLMIEDGKTGSLTLIMNIDRWFSGPNTWDFNYWGGEIMQNQAAMRAACENGLDVFSTSPAE